MEKKLKENEARMGTRLLPQPPPRPWEAKHSAPSIQKLLRGPWLLVKISLHYYDMYLKRINDLHFHVLIW